MNQPLTIHVGYHKTATTWMQNRLFVADHGYAQIADHGEIFAHVVQPHGLIFDPRGMADLIDLRRSGLAAGMTPVISSEILCGNPLYGGRESEVYAQRLARIAPDARILISIRDQKRILPSVYMQYLLRGGTMPWDRFFDGTDEFGYFGFSARHFEYHRLVMLYQDLFGASNVHVTTQESLKHDMDATAAAIAAFAGNMRFDGLSAAARQPSGVSYPEYTAPVLRRINHLQASTLNPAPVVRLGTTPKGLYKLAGYALKRPPLSMLLSGRSPVSDYVRTRFDGLFHDSNGRLAQIVGHSLDLTEYD